MTDEPDLAAPIEAVRSLRTEYEGLDRAAAQAGRAIARSLAGGVTQGRNFESVLQGVGKRLIEIGLRAALKPLENLFTQGIGNLFGGTGAGAAAPFAKGGVFREGRVTPFAQGGVVSSPTYFPMAGGTGLMGEAGPEAILPLARGADGRLGVRGAGGPTPPVQVTLNVTTPDAESFRRAEAQVAASLARAMARGRRAL